MELSLYKELPRHRRSVLLRGRDRAPLLSGETRWMSHRGTQTADRFTSKYAWSDAWVWDMYRPARLRQERQSDHLQGCARRGAGQAPTLGFRRGEAFGAERPFFARGYPHTPKVIHRLADGGLAGGSGGGPPLRLWQQRTYSARRGEDLAVEYLQRRGSRSCSRATGVCRDGELDVVATDLARLVVCEVKTRSSTAFGLPAEGGSPMTRPRGSGGSPSPG